MLLCGYLSTRHSIAYQDNGAGGKARWLSAISLRRKVIKIEEG
jgi:hypothetical protein